MASSEADLMAIGAHCDAPGCGMVDFLPFRCDCCSRNFCLDHRSYSAHSCTAAGHRTTEVIVCPLCARGVRLQAGQDPNEAFEQHTASTACDPRNYAKVHKKPRCPVGRCQEKLSLINTYHCKKCNLRVCLKHRLPDDHACLQAKAAQATQVVAAAAARRTQPPAPPPAPASRPAAVAHSPSLASSSAARSVAVADPSNTVKGTAARRAQQISGAPAGAGQGRGSAGGPGAAAQGAGGGMNEECPHCRAKFATVERLIQHVEEWHPATTSAGAVSTTATTAGRGALPNNNGSGLTWNPLTSAGAASAGAGAGAGGAGAGGAGRDMYRCHHCSNTFSDPVVLLQHSERCGQRGQTVSAGGSSGDGGRSAKGDCTIC